MVPFLERVVMVGEQASLDSRVVVVVVGSWATLDRDQRWVAKEERCARLTCSIFPIVLAMLGDEMCLAHLSSPTEG